MSDAPKAKGPASYFPSIESKYGQPVSHWRGLIEGRDGMTHMRIVAWLKEEHDLGHGHPNALVARALAQRGAA
jgi:hypothetical protein